MDKDLSDVLISGESEDYTIDDVITIGGTTTNTSGASSIPLKSLPQKIEPQKIETKINPIVHQDKIQPVNKADFENVEATMKDLIEKLSQNVSPNINKFASMTQCEENLKQLYTSLENLSKNRGSAKEIIDAGSKIQVFEDEKARQFINENDIGQTVEHIKNAISVLGKFKNMLESSKSNK